MQMKEESDPSPIENLHSNDRDESENDQPRDPEGPLKAAMETLFGSKSQRQVKFSALDESAKKAAPKVFFSAERTFLQWMHSGILVAGIAMALSSYSETTFWADIVGLSLLPVAIGMIIYAMFQCRSESILNHNRKNTAFQCIA